MHRRQFVRTATGALAAGTIAGPLTRLVGDGGQTARASAPAAMDAAAFHASRRYVRTRFGEIAYVERGSGEAALFLHGFPLNGFQWRGALDLLSPHRRCLAPDFMGLGYTEVAEGQSVALGAQAEMLVAFLDALSISTVDVVANDSGGGRAAPGRASSRARPHAAADQLRHRAGLPATGDPPRHRAGEEREVGGPVDRPLARGHGARAIG
jgi:haloalkane dehalogenase